MYWFSTYMETDKSMLIDPVRALSRTGLSIGVEITGESVKKKQLACAICSPAHRARSSAKNIKSITCFLSETKRNS